MNHRHLRVVPDPEPIEISHANVISTLRMYRDSIPMQAVSLTADGMVSEIDTSDHTAITLFEAMRFVRDKGFMTLNEMQQALEVEGLLDAFLDWEVDNRG
jgi:hypothetical protein